MSPCPLAWRPYQNNAALDKSTPSAANDNGIFDCDVMIRLPALGVGVGEAARFEGVVSPLLSETLPKIELATAQTWRRPFTTEGRSGLLRTSVWFVFSKQSTHCGKADWKVSVHAHLITSMKAPGLNSTDVKLARTGAACAQLLMPS